MPSSHGTRRKSRSVLTKRNVLRGLSYLLVDYHVGDKGVIDIDSREHTTLPHRGCQDRVWGCELTDIIKKEVITLPQVKEVLESIKADEMDQIQRWTYDYVRKFAKTDSESAEKMVKRLVEECELKPEEAIEIVNIMPTSIEELRAFTYGWKKLILTETLEKMLNILKPTNES